MPSSGRDAVAPLSYGTPTNRYRITGFPVDDFYHFYPYDECTNSYYSWWH